MKTPYRTILYDNPGEEVVIIDNIIYYPMPKILPMPNYGSSHILELDVVGAHVVSGVTRNPINHNPTPIPEPSTWMLFIIGLLFVGIRAIKKLRH